LQNSIKIQAHPEFLPERSQPDKSYYFFSYNIKIINNSEIGVKLLSRYWHIKDGKGQTEDVHGPGVVGKTPSIKPKGVFEYTSFCPLQTPIGFMEGSYRMISENGKQFDVDIPRFKLIAPQFLN
jgi:ApaG protein|tara:strand:- start:197 stop:568 length:372 start_codon:yes stop_codon:yes gene_type:complete